MQVEKRIQNAGRVLFGLVLFLTYSGVGSVLAQDVARTQGPIDLLAIQESVKKASQLLKDRKVVESVDLVEQSTKRILELVEIASAKELVELKKVHAELAKSHHSLSMEGAELTELPAWETMIRAKKKDASPKKTAPSGKETVSFAREIAPILIANCNGCHYSATRVSGGLQFNLFSQIIKGGDSGPIVVPSKPDESRIIRKLKGTEGARMPMGRPPLPDSQIQLIKTWIKEGATFDGQDKDAKLDQVVGQAFAAKASHSELMAKRAERTRDKWKTAFPKIDPDQATDEQFHVIGNIGDENANALLANANIAANQIRKMFKIPGKGPLVKGGITIFALKQRYDYSEFGRMIESRTLPTEWSSHWRSEVLDSYVAMVFDKSESKINETSLLQQLTSLWMSSHDGVPRWFSEGAGRQALAITVGVNDARVQPWLKRMPSSMDQVKNLESLSDGSMNDEALATIGFGIIRFMYDAKMKTQYETIVRLLASGTSFEQATVKTIGSMEVFLQRLLGKTK